MIKRPASILLLTGLLAGLAACSDSHYYGEEFSNYYGPPASTTTSERVERREIVHWKENPRDKKRIGFLYKYETKVKGSRNYRDSWYIYDRLGNKAVGFITAEGKFYRFDDAGRIGAFVTENPVAVLGLKEFFGIPLRENVDLEEIDPYRDRN
jgi:hypothetical protein